ncbi:MAG: hypothetical protein LBS21_01660 [Clostridiales bacterium]|jgi:hypothetical protein|nr:hypothetical protein [Clostridiales bacterium]
MSLDTQVAKIELNEAGGIASVKELINRNLLPLGVTGEMSLIEWYDGRRIPASRKNLNELTSLMEGSLGILLEKSMALSLSDSFWIKPADSPLVWKDVNFFTNEFTDDIGEFLVSGDGQIISYMSPSNTTDGMYPKKWVIIDGFRALIKQGDWRQNKFDDLNEIFASELLQILTRRNDVSYAPYFAAGNKMCASFNFVKEGQNLVSAYRYLLSAGRNPDIWTKRDCYDALLKPFGPAWIHTMLILDFLIFNCDRHFNNFGFIQDAQTGEVIKPAPIFDSGNSVWAALPFIRVSDIKDSDFTAKPFAVTHGKQIQLVDLKPFKDELFGIRERVGEIFYRIYKTAPVDRIHIDSMARVVKNRADTLCKMVN